MMEVKKEMDDEYCGKPEEKAKEQHGHKFSFKFENKDKVYDVFCTQEGTIYESLQESIVFKDNASSNQHRELVILPRPNKAISSHFPCHKLTKLEKVDTLHIKPLTIMYIRQAKNKTSTTSSKDKKENHGELVTFAIRTTGGANILSKVMKNNGLRKKSVDEVILYGYKGQTIREALVQDARFSDTVLQNHPNNYFLEDTEDGNIKEMSLPIDDLDSKCFKITKPKPQESHGAANHDAPQEATSSKTASSNSPTSLQNGSHQPTPSTRHQSTPNLSNQKSTYQPIPNSKDLLQLLRSQFKDLVKLMMGRENPTPQAVKKHLSQEFGKSTELCHEVRAMRRFLELGDSVCQVRIDASAKGSGFLLFGKYILTNGHVVLDEAKHPREKITVIFSYEELTDSQLMDVKVVASELDDDAAGHKHDWALLEVCDDLNAQPIKPLLKDFGLVTERGQICIIGHPKGEVKMIDPCFTIPHSKRELKMMFLTRNYYFPKPMDKDIHTYESCFYRGSSGSPVFDSNFKVVSMHSGGFEDKDWGHLLEYSHPLSLIIEQILIQIVRNKKVDVLLAMITCGIPPVVEDVVNKILSNDEGLVWTEEEMINLCAGDQACTKTELLKDFFRQRDESTEPEAMEF
ncbi:serine protease FAM111A-like [Gadus chalcogrammus]|uniref:serine protease FAM111A-like n=1 Tax=Gadus chalcogrammus TaxID=1042646 RepID=UPI0024C4943B|nr:serine protease FAM111A-like [Gadus chalcogrammus]XP_056451592.1 serine protease FAM111A-like [Gadus chalcogrammus]